MTSEGREELKGRLEELEKKLDQRMRTPVKKSTRTKNKTCNDTRKDIQKPSEDFTTPLDSQDTMPYSYCPRMKISTVLLQGEAVTGKAKEAKKDEEKGHLKIINLETNEDSAISRFWSIEPGSRQGIRIRIFRNGDRFFPGMEYAICHTKCRTLSYLLEQLTASSIHDPVTLPYGVRLMFNLQGQKIKDILELKDGGIYVVSSGSSFVKMDYLALQDMQKWKAGTRKEKSSDTDNKLLEVKKLNAIKINVSDAKVLCGDKRKKNVLIYVLRNEVLRPRKVIKWLLGPKSASTFEKVLSVLSEKLAFGCLRKLHSSDGTEVVSLEHLYLKANQVFFAFGQEAVKRSDFVLSKEEIATITEMTRKVGSQQAEKPLIIPSVHNDPGKPVLLEHYKLNDEVLCTNDDKVSLRMCKDVKNNTNYLLKSFDMRTLSKPQQLKVRREMKIMRMLKHTNLVYADIITFDDNFSCLYIKHFPKCSLAEILLNDKHYHCERFISDVVMQLSRGLEHLASYLIANRNVTLESVVTDITFSGLVQFKLCDFGLSRKIKSLDKRLYLICGNPFYIAPEMLLGQGYDTRVDVWSLGVLMYVLLTGEPPFGGSDNNDCNSIFEKISKGCLDTETLPVWNFISAEAKDLLSKLLTQDPNKRLSAQKVQTHAWTSQACLFAPEKDLRPVVKDSMRKHIVEQEMMSLDCLEVLCLSSIDKDPFYFVNTPEDTTEQPEGDNGKGDKEMDDDGMGDKEMGEIGVDEKMMSGEGMGGDGMGEKGLNEKRRKMEEMREDGMGGDKMGEVGMKRNDMGD